MAGVMRELGLRQSGGSHSNLTRKIRALDIDTSHFTGSRWNFGPEHKGGCERLSADQILIKSTNGRRRPAVLLRRALVDLGVPYRCECGLGSNWQGKPIMLQVDHLNRNWLDNRKENLRFICPNCHSQTLGWCGSKGGSEVTSRAPAERARSFRKKNKTKTRQPHRRPKHERPWPSVSVLREMVWKSPVLHIAKEIGVSEVSVKKHCTKRGIFTPPRGYWAKKKAMAS